MSIKQFRLSAQAREQLIRLKTRTGIGQWNILCRWAFCLSVGQPTPPTLRARRYISRRACRDRCDARRQRSADRDASRVRSRRRAAAIATV